MGKIKTRVISARVSKEVKDYFINNNINASKFIKEILERELEKEENIGHLQR